MGEVKEEETKKQEERDKSAAKLRETIESLGKGGLVTKETAKQALTKSDALGLVELQTKCEIRLTEAELLRIIDKADTGMSDGGVKTRELVDALEQQTGPAKSSETWKLKHDVEEMLNKQRRLHGKLQSLQKS